MKMNQKGFSLVELMIVVAIIGILATIGIPQYQKFQIRAKQSEGKTALSSVYTAMKAYQAEWGAYYNNFQVIGLQPEGNLTYNYGFAGGTPGIPGHPNSVVQAVATNFNAASRCVQANQVPTPAMPCRQTGGYPGGWRNVAGTLQNATQFRAHAHARFSNQLREDQWRIDQSKTITQQSDGLMPN